MQLWIGEAARSFKFSARMHTFRRGLRSGNMLERSMADPWNLGSVVHCVTYPRQFFSRCLCIIPPGHSPSDLGKAAKE
jgi:hypothetical protein